MYVRGKGHMHRGPKGHMHRGPKGHMHRGPKGRRTMNGHTASFGVWSLLCSLGPPDEMD